MTTTRTKPTAANSMATPRMPGMPNPNWAQLPLFDRSKWVTVRFVDVVELVSDTCRNPEAEGITRFIGMEHLEPGSLHIKTWGELVDGVTFTKRCRKGQVLFGKRRAYQRKVAIAEFDAVVSGDIYVFQAKAELLDPKLLPFLCMSERFFQFAVETSAGSLSPRTNWSHLKDFELALPPLDQQRHIAELLWAVDENLSAHSKVLEDTLVALASVFDSNADPKHGEHWQSVPLDRVVAKFIDYRGKTPVKTLSGVPLITARNVREGFLSEEPREFIAADDYDAWMRRGIPQAGDVLFTTEAPLGNVARIPTHDFALAQRIICLRPNAEVVEPDYFFWAMQSSHAKRKILERAHGTTVNGIKQSNLRQVLFPLPDRKVQLQVAEQCEALTRVKLASEAHLHSVGQMRSALLQEIFSQS